ncbi:hypothetical protein C1645_821818 [Glomus cerebriforme]|uniref:HCP-like protein n=1 Tax=Glomus cerebriforme TaxID=658196 RepID=A0A397T9F2_9GLOM|nr:hypothetical protein C1645_821818 [Glomus cerebriforme]
MKRKHFEFYLKSAEGGDKYALCKVGDYYYYGRSILKDESEVFEWYLKAAKKGHAYTQYKLADYYFYNSLNKNESKAFKWYLIVANKSNNNLKAIAKCYRDGTGTNKNLENGLKNMNFYQRIIKNL